MSYGTTRDLEDLMESDHASEITSVLHRISAGEAGAHDQLFELVFQDMRQMANQMMSQQPANHTLQPTAIVNEAAMRLLSDNDLGKNASRRLFFWTAARAMRRVLVDHARKRQAIRRGGPDKPVSLDVTIELIESSSGIDLIDLDEALNELREFNERHSEIVTLRFFGGFELKEIALQLEVSLSTIEKDWRLARIWLRRKLQ